MYNHNKAQQSSYRVHISWDILYLRSQFRNFEASIKQVYGNINSTCYPRLMHLHMARFWKKIPIWKITEFVVCIQFYTSGNSDIFNVILGKDSMDISVPVKSHYSISQEICTRFLLCCALLWLYIDWFSHIHQAYFTGTGQSNDCPSVSKATLMNMDKYFMWIHYERLHNHNKAKHNKTVGIFLGIYCIW